MKKIRNRKEGERSDKDFLYWVVNEFEEWFESNNILAFYNYWVTECMQIRKKAHNCKQQKEPRSCC